MKQINIMLCVTCECIQYPKSVCITHRLYANYLAFMFNQSGIANCSIQATSNITWLDNDDILGFYFAMVCNPVLQHEMYITQLAENMKHGQFCVFAIQSNSR